MAAASVELTLLRTMCMCIERIWVITSGKVKHGTTGQLELAEPWRLRPSTALAAVHCALADPVRECICDSLLSVNAVITFTLPYARRPWAGVRAVGVDRVTHSVL